LEAAKLEELCSYYSYAVSEVKAADQAENS